MQIATRILVGVATAAALLTAASNAPRLVHKVEPAYPASLNHQKVAGTAVLSLEVSPAGLPERIKVVRADKEEFAKPAIEAVSQWRFEPGLKDGQAVRVEATIVVDFRP